LAQIFTDCTEKAKADSPQRHKVTEKAKAFESRKEAEEKRKTLRTAKAKAKGSRRWTGSLR